MRKLALYSALGILCFIGIGAALDLSNPESIFQSNRAWPLGMSLVCYSVVCGHAGGSKIAGVTFTVLLIGE